MQCKRQGVMLSTYLERDDVDNGHYNEEQVEQLRSPALLRFSGRRPCGMGSEVSDLSCLCASPEMSTQARPAVGQP